MIDFVDDYKAMIYKAADEVAVLDKPLLHAAAVVLAALAVAARKKWRWFDVDLVHYTAPAEEPIAGMVFDDSFDFAKVVVISLSGQKRISP